MSNCKLDQMKSWMTAKTELNVYCRTGAMLTGTVLEYCDDSFILSFAKDRVLVFYNALTSIKPKGK